MTPGKRGCKCNGVVSKGWSAYIVSLRRSPTTLSSPLVSCALLSCSLLSFSSRPPSLLHAKLVCLFLSSQSSSLVLMSVYFVFVSMFCLFVLCLLLCVFLLSFFVFVAWFGFVVSFSHLLLLLSSQLLFSVFVLSSPFFPVSFLHRSDRLILLLTC
ncbi:hypothetical protein E2C01_084562 [Portunus trituberculatus]|uniref:Transmembrane protein n=1 Tax=Portunus trituberculatus TaxID=210409 RepID=A0A5B7J9M1_PORTR|nr:hypothetical protein [Portunus trituberculatus]